jgi:hypothetical protein
MVNSPIIELALKLASILDGYDVGTAADSIALARIIVIDRAARRDDAKRVLEMNVTSSFYGPFDVSLRSGI